MKWKINKAIFAVELDFWFFLQPQSEILIFFLNEIFTRIAKTKSKSNKGLQRKAYF